MYWIEWAIIIAKSILLIAEGKSPTDAVAATGATKAVPAALIAATPPAVPLAAPT